MNTEQKRSRCSSDCRFTDHIELFAQFILRQESCHYAAATDITEVWRAVGRNKYLHFP